MAELISLPTQESLKQKAINRIYSLVAVALAGLYVLSAMFAFTEKKLDSVPAIAGSFIASLVLGQSIRNLLRIQGVQDGRRTKPVEDAEERHRRLASRLIRKVNEVETWCIRKNEENLLRQRERILASAGMQYEDYFDEDGRPRAVTFAYEKVKGSWRFWERSGVKSRAKIINEVERKKERAFRRACRMRPTELSSALLIGSTQTEDTYHLGRTERAYLTQELTSGLVATIGIAAGTTYFGIDLIKDFDFAKLTMMAGQVIIYLSMGFVAMRQAYSFATGEYKERVDKQSDLMELFFDENEKEKEKAA